MNTYNDILNKIRKKEIDYPVLRQGETFVGTKIYLHIYKKSNNSEIGDGKLFEGLEEAIKYYNSLNLKGEYYLMCKEAKDPNSWRIEINF